MTEGGLPAQLLAIAAAFVLIWWGADALVSSAVRLARLFGVSDYLIGMTIVAIGTSAPEMVVTLYAAYEGHSDISIGNVVGSNVFNLGLILGLCGALWTVRTARLQVYSDVPLLIGAAALLLFFLRDMTLDGAEGAAFLVIFVLYAVWIFVRDDAGNDPAEEVPEGTATWKDGPRLALGLGGVLTGAYLLVTNAVLVARAAGISEWVIGATVVAAGTSLPELVTSIAAGRRGRLGLLAGNLIGSDIVNVLGVLGLAAFLNPLSVAAAAVDGVGMMLVAMCALLVMMRSGWRLSRAEGALLVAIALARWGWDLAQRSGGS